MKIQIDKNKILWQVIEMKDKIKTGDKEDIQYYSSKYNYLYTHTPSLFKMVYEDNIFYMDQLNFMMKMFSDVSSENMTEEDARKEVINSLNKKYIDSVVSKDSIISD